jgi:molybdenum cofactor cytidylyltransferase
MKISGLIIAAGLSGRMNSFKPLSKIDGKTFLEIITQKLLLVCDEIVIVTGYKKNLIEESLNVTSRIRCVFNGNYEQGMFTSLKRGLQESSNSDWVVYHFVDQPILPTKFYSEFIDQINMEYNWIQPAYNDVKGHPILLSQSIFPIIINEENRSSLKNVSQNTKVKRRIWNCCYPQVLYDIDTKKDFEKIIFQSRKQE